MKIRYERKHDKNGENQKVPEMPNDQNTPNVTPRPQLMLTERKPP